MENIICNDKPKDFETESFSDKKLNDIQDILNNSKNSYSTIDSVFLKKIKNREAAKRCRDKKQKEWEKTDKRLKYLESENIELSNECNSLKNENNLLVKKQVSYITLINKFQNHFKLQQMNNGSFVESNNLVNNCFNSSLPNGNFNNVNFENDVNDIFGDIQNQTDNKEEFWDFIKPFNNSAKESIPLTFPDSNDSDMLFDFSM